MRSAQTCGQALPEGGAATLGDVLNPDRSAANPTESDWVALVEAIARGDQLALHALFARARRLVFTLAVRITGSRETAEELTLDVFHDVWRRASRYDAANGTVLGWIMNQARSRAIDRLRFEQRKKRMGAAGEESPASEPVTGDALELKEKTLALRRALAALSPQERQVIEAAYFAELTHAEAAARLGQPLGTVKTRIRSALHKLRRTLEDGANRP